MKFTDEDRKPFARIIEVDGVQVLFYVEAEDAETSCMHQVIRAFGFDADLKVSGLPHDIADDALERMSEDNARTVLRIAWEALQQNESAA